LLAADEPPVPAASEEFKNSRIVWAEAPSYPTSENVSGIEGWVQVIFMISPKAEPYEIAVVESTGAKAFETAAIRAIRSWRFRAATLGNKPVDSSMGLKLHFTLDRPETKAAEKFRHAFTDVMKAIEADDRIRADAAFRKLKVRNLHEDAYASFANYHYHRKWGTEAQQINDLRRAIAHERVARYLNQDVFAGALDMLLRLEVQTQDFARALRTWELLQPIASKEMTQRFQPVMEEIKSLKRSDRPFSMTAHIDRGTSWHGDLFRNRFEIRVASGQVSEIKLRCEKQYVSFGYQPAVPYTVDPRHGSCHIEVIGEHDTKFDLIQS
jgi:TonB family protein